MSDDGLTPEQRERIARAFERVPYARLLGIEVGELKRGEAVLYLNAREELKQNHGVVHGGAIASLIDSASAFAILTLLEEGESTTTVDLTIHYLRPLTEGRMEARARVLRAGRRIIIVSVDVLGEGQKLAATALTTYLRLV